MGTRFQKHGIVFHRLPTKKGPAGYTRDHTNVNMLSCHGLNFMCKRSVPCNCVPFVCMGVLVFYRAVFELNVFVHWLP